MLLMILRVAYLLICAGAILAYITTETVAGEPAQLPRIVENNKGLAFFVLLLISQLVTIADLLVRKKRIEIISAIYFGILVGVLLAYLMIQALTPVVPVTNAYHTAVVLLTLLILPYICVTLLLEIQVGNIQACTHTHTRRAVPRRRAAWPTVLLLQLSGARGSHHTANGLRHSAPAQSINRD